MLYLIYSILPALHAMLHVRAHGILKLGELFQDTRTQPDMPPVPDHFLPDETTHQPLFCQHHPKSWKHIAKALNLTQLLPDIHKWTNRHRDFGGASRRSRPAAYCSCEPLSMRFGHGIPWLESSAPLLWASVPQGLWQCPRWTYVFTLLLGDTRQAEGTVAFKNQFWCM